MRKVKVKLDTQKMAVFGVFITHCEKRQWFGSDFLVANDSGVCMVCEKPLIVVLGSGKIYHLGEPIFEE